MSAILLTLMAKWREVLIFGLVGLCLIFYFGMKLSRAELKAANIQLETQNQAIEQWKLQSDMQAKRMAEAQKEVAKIKQKFDKELQEYMAAEVSAKCESAVYWAIQKAQKLGEDWRQGD